MKPQRKDGLMPSTGVGFGLLASALLGALTLSVFYVLRDYGPESAIRKYNQAVLDGDFMEVDQISTGEIRDDQWLLMQVQGMLREGGRLRLINMQRNPDSVRAFVEYVTPRPPPPNWLFVVRKVNHVWKIDTTETRKEIMGPLNGQIDSPG